MSARIPEIYIATKTFSIEAIDYDPEDSLNFSCIGSENIDCEVQNCCTRIITLPHSPTVESLNVAAVAVPLLFERRSAKMTLCIH